MPRKKPFSPEAFQQIYSQVPKLTVEVIVQTEAGLVLTLRGAKSWPNQWHIPGCTLLYQEYIEDAIQRVAQEELSISVEKQKFLGYIEYPSEEKERGFGWSVGLVFLCITDCQLPDYNQEGEKIQVFDYVTDNKVEEQKAILSQVLSAFKVNDF